MGAALRQDRAKAAAVACKTIRRAARQGAPGQPSGLQAASANGSGSYIHAGVRALARGSRSLHGNARSALLVAGFFHGTKPAFQRVARSFRAFLSCISRLNYGTACRTVGPNEGLTLL